VQISVIVEKSEPSWVRFSVSDNGTGIPHEYFDRVLEGFVQVEDRVTVQVPGLGVGLFMARRVVEAYGGSIVIQSRIGAGSTISFTLPVEDER
jgi:signal transduction histidine kinase